LLFKSIEKVGIAMKDDSGLDRVVADHGQAGRLATVSMNSMRMKRNTALLNKFKKHCWPYLFVLPFFILYFAFNLYPVLFTFSISLTNWDALFLNERQFVGLANYVRLFTSDPYFYQSILNTVGFMIAYIPLIIVLSLLLAVALFNVPRLKRVFQTLNLLPYITTPVAIGFIFSFLFDWSNGLVNRILVNLHIIPDGINWLGVGGLARLVVVLMIFWKNFGYFFIIYLAGLTGIPPEIHEAATVDGASKRQIFFHITLPYLRPITTFLVITAIIGGFQLFDEPFLLFSSGLTGNGLRTVGGPDRACLTTVWYFFDTAFRSTSKLGMGAAISYGLFLFILFFSILGVKIFKRKEEE
jgi:multiple sugar transport system permease protein/cellobiose transport system permease protein